MSLRWEFVLQCPIYLQPQGDHKGPYKRRNSVPEEGDRQQWRVLRQRDLKVRCHSLLDKRKGPESQERQENKTC